MPSLIKSVETKDLYTRGHSQRVSRASVLIGRQAGMREDRVSTLRYAGMLHDVGKLGLPTAVLQKAGRLTDDEYEAIQQHTVRGREIVKDLEFLVDALVVQQDPLDRLAEELEVLDDLATAHRVLLDRLVLVVGEPPSSAARPWAPRACRRRAACRRSAGSTTRSSRMPADDR